MIKISTGNTKMGNIPNTSLIPIVDCKGAILCKKKCYALKAWRQYPGVREAWSHNSKMWRTRPAQAAKSVISWIKARKSVPYFRIHVAGDFLNQRHLNYWKEIALACPNTKFKAFTKCFTLDFSNLPKNLLISFSMWPGVKAPTSLDRTIHLAWMQDGTEKRIPKGTYKCPGNCRACKVCWEKPTDTWAKEH